MAQAQSGIVSTKASKLAGVWIHDPSNPSATSSQFLYGNTSRRESLSVSSYARSYVGRANPVYDMGGFQSHELGISIVIPSGPTEQDQVEWFRSVLLARGILCYRDNRGRLSYGIIDQLDFSDVPEGTEVRFTFSTADYSEAI